MFLRLYVSSSSQPYSAEILAVFHKRSPWVVTPRAICIGFFFYIVFLCIVALLPIVCVLESKIAVEPFYFFHAFTLEPFERYIVDVAVCRYYITWLNRCAV